MRRGMTLSALSKLILGTLTGETDETPHLFLVLHADRPRDAAVHRVADSVRRRAVDAYAPRSRAADGRELYAVQMY